MNRYTFYEKDGKIFTPGISWGYGNPELEILYKTEHYMLWKKPGSFDWAGVGMQPKYYSVVYFLIKTNDNIGNVIEEVEPGRKWKKEKQRLIDKMKQLEGV